ncbi:MAG: peptidase [Clostridiales bacterium]|nr:peptidase [Clostridiales bacterium]
MNHIEKINRRTFALIVALVMMLSANVTAFAAAVGADLDLDRTGSITITLEDSDGDTVSGGEITIYQVAVLYFDNGNMAYELTTAFSDYTGTLDVTDTSLAELLADYVDDNDISGTSSKTVGSSGTVTFSNLELGLYLVVQTASSSSYKTISPFVVTVPIDDDGTWDYTVDASPKVGTVTPIEPDDPDSPSTPLKPKNPDEPEPDEPYEPTNPDNPTDHDNPDDSHDTPSVDTPSESSEPALPQTGQLNWPIPVLAVCGLVLFAVGWLLKTSDRKEKDL